MSNRDTISCIIKLSKLLTVLTESEFGKHQNFSYKIFSIDFKTLQSQIKIQNKKLKDGFPWYCGESILVIENSSKDYFILNEPKNWIEHKSLVKKAINLSQIISDHIIANYSYQDIFTELNTLLNKQIKLEMEDELIFEEESVLVSL